MQKSPFPGMDPYLELDWLDVHSRLVTYACDQLQERLPSDLVARMESRVLLEDDAGQRLRSQHPDVRVVEDPSGGVATAVLAPPEIALAQPDVVLSTETEPATERYLEIVDAATRNRVITTIEFVSPTNKRPGIGQALYLKKQAECREAGVNLVEIDLTRGGDRFSILPFLQRLTLQPCYVACVRRGHDPDPVEVHYLPLAQRLKPILIPLRRSDADVILHLQPLVEQAYDRGRYGSLDYTRQLDPPFTFQEAAWCDEWLRSAGKR
jgi:Protein of unknown function (DUF4058)